MKKGILALLLGVLALAACSKKSDNKPAASREEAKPAFDNKNYGVYKGVLVGSSGTFRLEIGNFLDQMVAYVEFDGVKDTLNSTYSFYQGSDVRNASFAGKRSTMTFSVNADGSNPQIVNVTITGHPDVKGVVFKETSVQEVKCFEGTFNGDDNGVFNIAIVDKSILGLIKSIPKSTSMYVNGSLLNGRITGTTQSGTDVSGTMVNDSTISGTWKIGTEKGNWSGKLKR